MMLLMVDLSRPRFLAIWILLVSLWIQMSLRTLEEFMNLVLFSFATPASFQPRCNSDFTRLVGL